MPGFPEDTTVLVLSEVTDHRLAFVLSDQGLVHNGDRRSQRYDDGTIANAWDWGIESNDLLVDRSGRRVAYLASYVLPIDDQVFLVGHSLGDWPEYPLALIGHEQSHRDAARLLERELPHLWSAWEAGVGMPEGHGLIKVRTSVDHWFYGAALPSRDTSTVDVDPAAVAAVRDRCLAILGELVGFPGNVDGILDVLPPDQVRERLERWSGHLSKVTEVLGHLKDIAR